MMVEEDATAVKQESYYQILDFLDYQNKTGNVSDKALRDFKEVIRNNKYVSTYIRALKNNFDEIEVKTYDDYIRLEDKAKASKNIWSDRPPWILRNLIEYNNITDPIVVIRNLIKVALEREGKICDFRDSVHSNKIFGVCQSENHLELAIDNDRATFNEDTEEYEMSNEIEELELTLYSDDDTAKYNDHSTCYICKMCMEDLQENGDSAEVSCDLE
jgi:hypothetical protein